MPLELLCLLKISLFRVFPQSEIVEKWKRRKSAIVVVRAFLGDKDRHQIMTQWSLVFMCFGPLLLQKGRSYKGLVTVKSVKV